MTAMVMVMVVVMAMIYLLPKGGGGVRGGLEMDLGRILFNLGNMRGLATLQQPHAKAAFGTSYSRRKNGARQSPKMYVADSNTAPTDCCY